MITMTHSTTMGLNNDSIVEVWLKYYHWHLIARILIVFTICTSWKFQQLATTLTWLNPRHIAKLENICMKRFYLGKERKRENRVHAHFVKTNPKQKLYGIEFSRK